MLCCATKRNKPVFRLPLCLSPETYMLLRLPRNCKAQGPVRHWCEGSWPSYLSWCLQDLRPAGHWARSRHNSRSFPSGTWWAWRRAPSLCKQIVRNPLELGPKPHGAHCCWWALCVYCSGTALDPSPSHLPGSPALAGLCLGTAPCPGWPQEPHGGHWGLLRPEGAGGGAAKQGRAQKL